MIKTMSKILSELRDPIDSDELQRAKNIFKSHVY
jgi:hypothetical protein